MKEALLVIDIDHADNWKPEDIETFPERKKVAGSIKALLDQKRAGDELIIFVIFPVIIPGKNLNCIVCDCGDDVRLAEFLKHRCNHPKEPVFIKHYVNAFRNADFVGYLEKEGITELKIAGCQTSCCVLETALGAVSHGLNVSLIADCVYPPFEEEKRKLVWLEQVKERVSSPHVSVQII